MGNSQTKSVNHNKLSSGQVHANIRNFMLPRGNISLPTDTVESIGWVTSDKPQSGGFVSPQKRYEQYDISKELEQTDNKANISNAIQSGGLVNRFFNKSGGAPEPTSDIAELQILREMLEDDNQKGGCGCAADMAASPTSAQPVSLKGGNMSVTSPIPSNVRMYNMDGGNNNSDNKDNNDNKDDKDDKDKKKNIDSGKDNKKVVDKDIDIEEPEDIDEDASDGLGRQQVDTSDKKSSSSSSDSSDMSSTSESEMNDSSSSDDSDKKNKQSRTKSTKKYSGTMTSSAASVSVSSGGASDIKVQPFYSSENRSDYFLHLRRRNKFN